MSTITGQCHCGNLTSVVGYPSDVNHLTLFGCSCTYCRLHGLVWLGRPAQSLRLAAEDASFSHWYCTGPLHPCYLVCQHCGVVVATVCQFDNEWYGIMNAQTAVLPTLPQDFVSFRPDSLTDEERQILRKQRFVRGVQFEGGLQPPAIATHLLTAVATL